MVEEWGFQLGNNMLRRPELETVLAEFRTANGIWVPFRSYLATTSI